MCICYQELDTKTPPKKELDKTANKSWEVSKITNMIKC